MTKIQDIEMEEEEMAAEYEFDYGRARTNRFADMSGEHRQIVYLDPDVARVFSSSESVNRILRAIIAAMPESERPS